ncbi:MAG: phage holin family protein, partial [Bacteroidaceae bacterium]|nr:phage holin family protein [Bacteroidaceae bacterium]
SLINALLWPILTRIAMPFLVLTFGIGTLILNGLLLQFFAPLFNIEIKGAAMILAPLAMAAVTTILSSLITIEDDSSYYRSVLRDAEKKRKTEIKDYDTTDLSVRSARTPQGCRGYHTRLSRA